MSIRSEALHKFGWLAPFFKDKELELTTDMVTVKTLTDAVQEVVDNAAETGWQADVINSLKDAYNAMKEDCDATDS